MENTRASAKGGHNPAKQADKTLFPAELPKITR